MTNYTSELHQISQLLLQNLTNTEKDMVIPLLEALLSKLKNLLIVTNAAEWYCKDLREQMLDIQTQMPVRVTYLILTILILTMKLSTGSGNATFHTPGCIFQNGD